MTFTEKAQSFIILAAVFMGLALGTEAAVAQKAGSFIVPLLILMLAGVFLQVPLRDFGNAFLHRHVAMASLIINFIWTPAFVWLLGWLFLHDHPALWVGFIMLMVTPCTDWYLVFTGIARGNLALSTALLPVNMVLQLALLPAYLFLLAGSVFPLDWSLIIQSAVLVLLLPFLAASGLRHMISRYKSRDWLNARILPPVQSAQTVLLALAIAAIFASEGKAITENPHTLLHLLPPLALFFCCNLLLALIVSKALRSSYENFVSLSCTTLARNSPIALAIALVAFPHEPMVAIALVVGPLMELPVLALISQALLWMKRKEWFESCTQGRETCR